MMQVLINDQIVSYEQTGKGPVALLVHGWADSGATFKLLTKQLQSSLTIVTVDLPGFGASDAPSEAWGLTEYAQFLSVFLQKIKQDPHKLALLVGHSNGGAISVHAVAQKIVTSKKLVLLASSGIRSNGGAIKTLLRIIAKSGKAVTAVLPAKQQRKIQALFYRQIGSDFLVAPHMKASFKKIVAQDILQDAQQIHVPTLLIYGTTDTATPVKYGQAIAAEIKGSSLHIVESDHFVHQTLTAEVAALITEFAK